MKQTQKLLSLLLVLALLVTSAAPVMAMSTDPGAEEIPGEAITSVKVSDIATPVVGAKPDFDLTLTGTGVTLNDDEEGAAIMWWYDDTLTGTEYDLDETSIFAPGCYWMYIYLEAEDGYQFTEDTKFYFDKEALPYEYEIDEYFVSSYWYNGHYAVIYLSFIVKPEDPCTVTFAANGGKGTMAPVTNAGGLYTLPECGFTAPTGKVFQCWSINGAYTVPGEQILVAEDTIVIAIWAKSVTISFDAGGGSGTMASVTVPSGYYSILPECGFTAPAGKQFLHWSVEGYRMLPGQWLEEVTEDITVTAVWGTFLTSVNVTGIIAPVAGQKANTSAITVNTENMTIRVVQWLRGTMVMSGQTFEAGKTYTLVIYLNVAEGYGIADDVVITHDLPGAVASYNQTNQRIALEYTVPASAPCTISFVANGGTGTMASVTRSLGSNYTLPECGFTAPAGKQFKCWNVDGSEKAPGDTITVTADTTVTAVWGQVINSISITGIKPPVVGQLPDFSGITTDTPGISFRTLQWLTNGSTVMNGSIKFEAGVTYQFYVGYEVAEGYMVPDSVTINHDLPGGSIMTINTYWKFVTISYTVPEVTTYTVSFAANGGSGTMAAVTGVSGTYTLPTCGFTAPTGKQFKCWSVNGTEKAAGDTITVTADTTVTALWTQTTIRPFIYTVSFDPGTGTGTMAPEITDGRSYTLPKCTFTAPTRSLFLGWVVNTALYNPGDTITVTENITVTALWVKSSLTGYIVTYNGNGGTGTMTPRMNVSGGFTLPECGYTAPVGQEFQAYLINGTEYQPGDVITVSAPTIISVLWKAASQGVAVSGTVTSFNDETGEITLHLISQGMTEPAYEAIVTGNTASYSFAKVLAGTYTLRVSKKNHVTREYTVVVGETAIVQDVKIHLKGDVDGSGSVNMGDFSRIYAHVRKTTVITDSYMLLCADATGDSKVNMGDFSAVYSHVKKTSLLW